MLPQYDQRAKRVPKRYPAFGNKLYSLVLDHLPQGMSRDRQGVVSYFRKQPDFGFDTTCTYAWLRGDVSGTKPLVVDNFKRILLFYMGKNGLSTFEEIHQWIASGPRKFEKVLECEEIQTMLRNKSILRADHEPVEGLAERKKIWKRILHLIQVATFQEGNRILSAEEAATEHNVIVIQGPPGVGKTMMLERLQSNPGIQACFDEILFASCDEHTSLHTFLDFWQRKIVPDQTGYPDHPAFLTAAMRKALRGKRVLLLADNLSTPDEIKALKPFCDLGCLLILTTRSLEVARQANYSRVIEMIAYSKKDVLEYYSKNYAAQPSTMTQEKLLQLAKMVCFNPLGLNISLRRVAEEGWETVMEKVRLAPSIDQADVFEDLHKPLWLAFTSLGPEDQDHFRKLGAFPNLASYDEDRLSKLWGVSKTRANEILVRFEKEAGLARRCWHQNGHWHVHPQVLNFARCYWPNDTFRSKALARFYPLQLAMKEKRPCDFHPIYPSGIRLKIIKKYWQMMCEEGRRRRRPILLGELRRMVDPTYSTDWSIFIQLTSNCTLADYVWGYRNYLEGSIDHLLFFIGLILIGVINALKKFVLYDHFRYGISSRDHTLDVCLLTGFLVFGFYLMARELQRRYDWAQLWDKMMVKMNEFEDEEYGGEVVITPNGGLTEGAV